MIAKGGFTGVLGEPDGVSLLKLGSFVENKCQFCRYMHARVRLLRGVENGLKLECHRYAPTSMEEESEGNGRLAWARWPAVEPVQWCGEFEMVPGPEWRVYWFQILAIFDAFTPTALASLSRRGVWTLHQLLEQLRPCGERSNLLKVSGVGKKTVEKLRVELAPLLPIYRVRPFPTLFQKEE